MSTETPRISVVIPCRNEEKYIESCILSIINSDYPKDQIEILVCDGLSTDNTTRILERLASKYPMIQYLVNAKQTTPYGLNRGITKSTGDIVIILGAHSEIHTDFIKECVYKINIESDIGCVGGVLDNVFEDSLSESIALAMSSPFGVGSAHFRTGLKDGYVDTVAFGAYKRHVIDKIGLFDTVLVRNQDDEYNFRVTEAGYKIYLSKDIRAKYYVRASFGKLFKQYYQYGFWKVYVNKKHQTITTLRQLIPALFVLALITLGGLSTLDTRFAWILLGLLAVYFAGGFMSALIKTWNPISILRVLFSFVILHISYGTGYLVGLIDFVVMNKKPGTNG